MIALHNFLQNSLDRYLHLDIPLRENGKQKSYIET